MAALNNHPEIVKYLLEKRADIMKKNYEAKTCLDMAVDRQHVKLVDELDDMMRREVMWRNRNCLLKIGINREKTPVSAFKNISLDLFREIIKYA